MNELFVDIVCFIGAVALVPSSLNVFKGNLSSRDSFISHYMYFGTLFNTGGWLAVVFFPSILTEYRCAWNGGIGLMYLLLAPYITIALSNGVKFKKTFTLLLSAAILITATALVFVDTKAITDYLSTYTAIMFFLSSISIGVYLLKTRNILDFSTVLLFLMAIDPIMQGFTQFIVCDFDTSDCSLWFTFRTYYGTILMLMWGLYTYNYGIRRAFK